MEEELGESLERSQTFVVQMSFDATCAAFTDMLDTSQVYLRPVQWNNLADGLKVVEFQVDVVDLGAVDDYEEVDEDCYDLTLRDVEIRLRTMDNQSTRVEVKGWEGSTLIVPEGAVHQPPLVARALWFDNFMDHFYEDLSQAGIPVDWPLPPIMKLQGMTVLQASLNDFVRNVARWNVSERWNLEGPWRKRDVAVWAIDNCLIKACEVTRGKTEIRLDTYKLIWPSETYRDMHRFGLDAQYVWRELLELCVQVDWMSSPEMKRELDRVAIKEEISGARLAESLVDEAMERWKASFDIPVLGEWLRLMEECQDPAQYETEYRPALIQGIKELKKQDLTAFLEYAKSASDEDAETAGISGEKTLEEIVDSMWMSLLGLRESMKNLELVVIKGSRVTPEEAVREFFEKLDTTSPALGDGQGEKGLPAVQHLAWLRQNIAEYFNLDELRTLCFDMGIKHENLASTLDGMARELVDYCKRTGKISDLVAKLTDLRPKVSWEARPE